MRISYTKIKYFVVSLKKIKCITHKAHLRIYCYQVHLFFYSSISDSSVGYSTHDLAQTSTNSTTEYVLGLKFLLKK